MAEEAEELETSTSSEEIQDDQVTDSSSEQGEETEETLLSVVQDAMKKEEVEEESPPSEVNEEEESKAESSEPSDVPVEADTEEENFDDVPFHKHPRFKEVIDQRNKYKSDSAEYQKITGFLESNNISAEEAAEGFKIMALMKSDPKAALEALNPYVKDLGISSGVTMPEDIQKKVNEGYLDEDAARELSQAKAQATQNQKRLDALEQQNAANQIHAQRSDIASVVTEWEQKTKQSDPDYSLKSAEIDDRVKVLVAESGVPKSSTEAIAIANKAYEEVNKRHSARSTKRPIKTASGGKLSGTPHAEPKNLHEAVALALQNGAA
jgi:hypothetical protein